MGLPASSLPPSCKSGAFFFLTKSRVRKRVSGYPQTLPFPLPTASICSEVAQGKIPLPGLCYDDAITPSFRGSMRVLITGSSGLIGSALLRELTAAGHQTVRLVRSRTHVAHDAILWDPESNLPPALSDQEIDAVIHLAGENIAARRWTPEQKARIRESRVAGTRLLCESLTRLSNPPKTLVSASAIGYYGNRGDEILREETPAGSGFLAQVCREWEEAAAPAAEKG